ncbi:hypothetical protein ACFYZH_32030 [Streptomyces abikoensis]|uniref:hypothetical protein n=1 Tax=Streptomyces abikoensis TaxID=97398 RepID=UPI0036B2F997
MRARMLSFFPPPPPDQALRRLHEAVQRLYAAAGRPSLRTVSERIKADDSLPATVSHQTVSVILTGRQLTQRERLHAVVVQLLRMDGSSTRPEAEVVAEVEALWHVARREKEGDTALPDVPAARAFFDLLHTVVLEPLSALPEAGQRLRAVGFSPAALANIAGGIRRPNRQELDFLLHLLTEADREPPAKARQELVRAYHAMLRHHAPVQDEQDPEALRRHAADLEAEVALLRERHREENLRRDAREAALRAAAEEARQALQSAQRTAAGSEATAQRRQDETEQLRQELARTRQRHEATARRLDKVQDELKAERWRLHGLQRHVGFLRAELKTVREESQHSHATAAVMEAAATVATARADITTAGLPHARLSDPAAALGYERLSVEHACREIPYIGLSASTLPLEADFLPRTRHPRPPGTA